MAAALMAAVVMLAGCGEQADEPQISTIYQGPSQAERDIKQLRNKLERVKEKQAVKKTQPAPLEQSNAAGLGEGLAGEIGYAIGSPAGGEVTSGGELTSGSAWSTIKVPIALAVLADTGGPTGLSAAQQDEIQRALTASDNEAAAALFDDLGATHGGIEGAAQAVTDVLRQAGDTETFVSTVGRDGFSPYGQTDWALTEQLRFVSALGGGCVGSEASRAYVLELMGAVSSDTWGLGSIGMAARWKGGWGPDPAGNYLVRQMGLVETGRGPVAAALAVQPDDGSFATGQALASELAAEIAAELDRSSGQPLSC